MSPDIRRTQLLLESEGGGPESWRPHIDCTGSGLGYWVGSSPLVAWFPKDREPEEGQKEAPDPLPCLVSPLVPPLQDFL